MASNAEIWDSYYDYTGELTKHSRYLGFAGVAICWFFRSPTSVVFPNLILWSLGAFVTYFLFDLIHYFVGALRLRLWMYREERQRIARDEDLNAAEYWLPENHDRPIFALFCVKLLALVIGFLLIGGELISQGAGAAPLPPATVVPSD